MEVLLESAEGVGSCRGRKAVRDEELTELRCRIAALRCQLEGGGLENFGNFSEATCFSQGCLSDRVKEDEEAVKGLVGEDCEPDRGGKDIEMFKRQYMAALIAAREKPGEETLALAAGLRSQLESFLAIFSFSTIFSDPTAMPMPSV